MRPNLTVVSLYWRTHSLGGAMSWLDRTLGHSSPPLGPKARARLSNGLCSKVTGKYLGTPRV